MHLHIVQPTTYTTSGALFQTGKRRMIGLSLPYLAALTPKEWQVQVFDERLAPVDFDAPCDVVAITVWTRFSKRAYEIAAEYKKRGIPVLMGGPHTYFYGDEVAKHCDAYAVGEADNIWAGMLADAAAGQLQKVYQQFPLPDMKGLPRPRYDLISFKHYPRPRVFQVQTTRGCPFGCDFCEETVLYGKKFRSRPVDEVVEEIRYIKSLGSSIIFFADSVFAGTKRNCQQVLEALVPLKIRWASLWPMNYCADNALIKLAKQSGCMHMNMGMESVDADTLASMKKRQNKVQHYDQALANLNHNGITYSLNFVFGWDTESDSVYEATLRYLEENHVPMAFFNILNPRRGTGVYQELKQAGRLLDESQLNKLAGMNCQFIPKHMTPDELVNRVNALHREFYSPRSVMRRMRPGLRTDFWGMLGFNLYQWNQARKKGFGNLDQF